jgi:septum formation protein
MIATVPMKRTGKPEMAEPVKIILASGSRFRRQMLEQAGLKIHVVAADIDETKIKNTLLEDNPDMDACEVAEFLARAKALKVSATHPRDIIIGADQVLVCGGEIFSKPASVAAARTQLLALRGLSHALPTAVVLAQAGQVIWAHVDEPELTMRSFSESFLDAYLSAEQGAVTETVGGYAVEGRGSQLFEAIEGDYFSIIGLPLLPLLSALRSRGLLQE